jgi:hypothetical protein
MYYSEIILDEQQYKRTHSHHPYYRHVFLYPFMGKDGETKNTLKERLFIFRLKEVKKYYKYCFYSSVSPEIPDEYFSKTIYISNLLNDKSYSFNIDFAVSDSNSTRISLDRQTTRFQNIIKSFNANNGSKVDIQVNTYGDLMPMYYRKPNTKEVIKYHYLNIGGFIFHDKILLKLLETGIGDFKYDGMGMFYLEKLNLKLEDLKSEVDFQKRLEIYA